jgi:hypothetical protein
VNTLPTIGGNSYTSQAAKPKPMQAPANTKLKASAFTEAQLNTWSMMKAAIVQNAREVFNA